MNRITNYTVATSVEVESLKNEVAQLIRQGWQPFGSVSTSLCYLNKDGHPPAAGVQYIAPRTMYTQALVQYATD